ncbi:MAG: heparinase II/III family protein [Gammaproteobacteria bacterium]
MRTPLARTLARYWHTLRPLKPVQVYGRIWFHLHHPHPDARPPPPLGAHLHVWKACEHPPVLMGPDRFHLLGVERQIASPGDWNRADWPRLWRYHLHYFEDWTASGANTRAAWHEALIARWIAENPPGRGIGWDPYPISRRIVNWIQWALARTQPNTAVCQSLAIQTRYLRRRLEFHLLGNHLWTNAKALIFAGSFFSGPEAEKWLKTGLMLLERERNEEILADGGHFERSPLYHAILLEDLLDLVQLAGIYPGRIPEVLVATWRQSIMHMFQWLWVMTHPDGRISFFNDAAFDLARDYSTLVRYAADLGLSVGRESATPIIALPQSGYIRLETGQAVLIADLAPIGPDYQPGHAHADTLSFELSLGRRRVLVNGGTSTYEAGPDRERQRGTALHNTVVVDGEDSSEVWGSFRVARRARPESVRSGQDGDQLWIEGAHDGYRRLPGRVTHGRRFELTDRRLKVIDTLTGRFREAQAFFRFAPGVVVEPMDRDRRGERPATIRWRCLGARQATLQPGTWHPRFGACEDCKVLVLTFARDRLETEFSWD